MKPLRHRTALQLAGHSKHTAETTTRQLSGSLTVWSKVLLGVRVWRDRIRPAREARVQVAVRTDSAAAMGAALTWRSPSPRLNEIAKELSADAAAGLWMLDVVEHVPGLANVWADRLSHLGVPQELVIAKAEETILPSVDDDLWLTRTEPPAAERVVLTPASKVSALPRRVEGVQ